MSDVAVAQETDAQVAGVEKRTEDVADLDTLLAEFDKGTTKPDATVSQPEQKPATIDPATLERVKRVEDRLFQEDVNDACKEIFEGLNIPRRAQIGWLDQIAREMPGVGKAFLNKANDPAAWKRFAKSLSKEAEKDFKVSKVDEEATADHAAVAAAVRGASTKVAPEPAPDFAKMSNAELQKWKMENMKG